MIALKIPPRLLAVLAILLSLSCVVYPQACPSSLPWQDRIICEVEQQWNAGSWQSISMTALMMMFLLVVLAYMLSAMFGSRELKMWAKAEFLQVVASSFFVIALLVLVQAMVISVSQVSNNIASTMSPQPPATIPTPSGPAIVLDWGNPFALSHYYFDMQINCAKKYYRAIFWVNLILEPMEKAVFPTGGMDEITGWVLSGPVGIMYWIAHNIDFLLLVNYFQRHLLLFIEDNALKVLLPVGVVLRIMPYTRGAGGVIMAIALGLFFVYPLTYVVILGMMPRSQCTAVVPSVYSSDFCESIDPTCAAQIIAFINEQSNFTDTNTFITQVSSDLNMMFISAIVFPIVNFTITLTFIRSILQFLGADVAEMGEGIIKLI